MKCINDILTGTRDPWKLEEISHLNPVGFSNAAIIAITNSTRRTVYEGW